MNAKRLGVGLAAFVAGSIALAGCASGSNNGADSSKIVTSNGSEPQNPLVPANTGEAGGAKIIELLFAGLVHYNADGSVSNEAAESIESPDAQNYTVKLKKGLKFSDGTPVTASSFVKAWNDGAQVDNAYMESSFYEDIEGFETSPGPDGKLGTKDDETGAKGDMSGLKVVDDQTFTIKLKHPVSDFKNRLGFEPFFPLPEAYFKDKKGFGEHPIGNGPYKLANENAWEHNVQISLVKNDSYSGSQAAKNGGVTLKFYQTIDSAYADLLANNLDVIDDIPAASLAKYKEDLGSRAISQPSAANQMFVVPSRLPHFSGEEGQLRRQALSMAINRNEITEKVFHGSRTVATDFTSPVVAGYEKSIAGSEVLQYNPTKAKELWEKANAIAPWSGKFEIAYNADSSHGAWVDAVTNSIKNTLGIDASGKAYPTFKELRTQITSGKIDTAFRSGWQGDYPSQQNFLAPVFKTGADANDAEYSNPDFDALIDKGATAATPAEAAKEFNEAQKILLKDLPSIPLWYQNANGGYSENVSDVKFGWNGIPLYSNIVKK